MKEALRIIQPTKAALVTWAPGALVARTDGYTLTVPIDDSASLPPAEGVTMWAKELKALLNAYDAGGLSYTPAEGAHISREGAIARARVAPLLPPAEERGGAIADGLTIARDDVARVLYAVDQKDVREHLRGVLWTRDTSGQSSFVTTDGARLAKVATASAPAIADVILSVKGVLKLLRLMKRGQTVNATVCAGNVLCVCDSWSLAIARVPLKYPDYERVLPAPGVPYSVSKAALLSAIARIRATSPGVTSVRISPGVSVLTLSANGVRDETLACKSSLPAEGALVNIAYFTDAVKACVPGDAVVISMQASANEAPIVLDGEHLICQCRERG